MGNNTFNSRGNPMKDNMQHPIQVSKVKSAYKPSHLSGKCLQRISGFSNMKRLRVFLHYFPLDGMFSPMQGYLGQH